MYRIVPRVLESTYRGTAGIALFIFSILFILSPLKVRADGQFGQVYSTTGRKAVVANGVGMLASSSGDIALNVPGEPVKAFLYWAGYHTDPGGDDTVNLAVDGGSAVAITADTTYGPDYWFSYTQDRYHYVYRADITAHVLQGNHTYTVSDFIWSGRRYGSEIVVVYQDPSLPFQAVFIQEGLDAAYHGYGPPRGPNTETNILNFNATEYDRDMQFIIVAGGVQSAERPNAVWYQTGNSTVPDSIIDNPQATEIFGTPPPLSVSDGDQWDTYQDSITVAAGDNWAAFQIESVDDIVGENGASLLWVSLAAAMPTPYATIAGKVWNDEDKNGLQGEAESGIAGVTVHLLNTEQDTVATTTTDANGDFTFEVEAPANYSLSFETPYGYYFTAADQGTDDSIDSDADPQTGQTVSFAVSDGVTESSFDAGMIRRKESDLAIAKTASAPFVLMGEKFYYTLQITNNGPDDANNVMITEALPGAVTFISATPTQDMGPNPLIWNIASLPVGDTLSIRIDVKASEILSITNIASVYCEQYDPDMTNNSAGARVDILTPVELTSFRAFEAEDGIKLSWTTQSETENLGFHIYRAEEENGIYLQITDRLIAGAGNSEQQHHYSYYDRSAQPGKIYYYKLADISFKGIITMSEHIQVQLSPPAEYALEQNFPNPFNPETKITFKLKESGFTTLEVFNMNGQKVRTLVANEMPTGTHQVIWDGKDDNGKLLPSGHYICSMRVNGFQQTIKVSFMK